MNKWTCKWICVRVAWTQVTFITFRNKYIRKKKMKPFYQLCTSIVGLYWYENESDGKKTFCLYQQTDNLVGRRKKWRLTQNDCTMLPNNNSIFALCYAKQHLSMLIVVLSHSLSHLLNTWLKLPCAKINVTSFSEFWFVTFSWYVFVHVSLVAFGWLAIWWTFRHSD